VRAFAPRALIVGLAPCAFVAWSRSARAEPLPVKLSWDAPSECPSYDDVMGELERIARVRPGRVLASIRAEAKIERTKDGRYKLRLVTQREDQRGETELDATTCPPLERGVTLVLALALGDGVEVIDDKASAPAPLGNPSDRSVSARARFTPESHETTAASRTPERDAKTGRAPLHWSPWLAAAAAWGLLARPSIGNRIGVAVGQVHWDAMAHATFWPPVSVDRVQGIDASFIALIGAAGACGRAPFGAWSISACAVFEIGAIRGKSVGAFRDGSATAPWYAASPSLVLTAPIYGPVKLRAEPSLSIALDPPHFAIESVGEVYVVSRYVPAMSLGLAFDR
jgi:hypothetical protein